MTLLTGWCGFAKTEPASLKPVKFNCRHSLVKKVNAPGAVYLHANESLKCWAFRSKLKVILSSEQPADVSFYFFFFFDWHFLSSFFFFSCFFYYFTKWKVIGKTANTNVRNKLRPQSFEMWDKQVICTFK